MLLDNYRILPCADTAIGNAKIEGLEADLNMKGTDYNLVAAIFFIPYLMFGKCLRDCGFYSWVPQQLTHVVCAQRYRATLSFFDSADRPTTSV